MKPIPREENPEIVLVAILFNIDSPQPPSNTKPIPQEENPETVLVAVLFEKDKRTTHKRTLFSSLKFSIGRRVESR